jgi:hypothetical protein
MVLAAEAVDATASSATHGASAANRATDLDMVNPPGVVDTAGVRVLGFRSAAADGCDRVTRL